MLTKKILNLYKKIKELVKHLPTLHLPLESKYKIIQTDASQTWWGGILLVVTNIEEEKLCRYYSGTFNAYQKNHRLRNWSNNLSFKKISIVFKPRTIYFKNRLWFKVKPFNLQCESIYYMVKMFLEEQISQRFFNKLKILKHYFVLGYTLFLTKQSLTNMLIFQQHGLQAKG